MKLNTKEEGMKKIIILLICIFAIGCGDYYCEGDFVTKHNICTYLNGADSTKENIEHVFDVAEKYTVNRFGFHTREKIFNGWNFNYIELFYVDDADSLYRKQCDGCSGLISVSNRGRKDYENMYFKILVEKDAGCFGNMTLAHEFLHLFDALINGYDRYSSQLDDHPPEFFMDVYSGIFSELSAECDW